MDRRLLNGHPKVTMIQRFNRTFIVIKPDCKKEIFKDIKAAKKFIEENNYEVSVSHLLTIPDDEKA